MNFYEKLLLFVFCRICDCSRLTPVLDLGMQPWGNHFLTKEQIGTEPFYPLRLMVCEQCAAAQLDYTVKKEILFTNSSATRTSTAHFKQLACSVNERFFKDQPKKSALDIGSNTGIQLQAFQELGYNVLGVESSRSTAQIAIEQGVPTLPAFYNLTTANQIGQSFDVINASQVFCHLEELHSVSEAIAKYLKPNGVFVVQFLYMHSILETTAFDRIHHEHLLYYTLKTISHLLNRHGLQLFDAELSSIHGGSIIGYASHSREPTPRLQKLMQEEELSGCNNLIAYQLFANRVQALKQENLSFLEERKRANQRIVGLGASAKANTLLNYFGITSDTIECLVEKKRQHAGLFSPGTHLPIFLEQEAPKPDLYYVLLQRSRQELLNSSIAFYHPLQPKESLCIS